MYGVNERFGAQETNAITPEFKEAVADVDHTRFYDWTEVDEIARLRLVSDPGYPLWDVSYCYGIKDGKQVRVSLPFSELPKKNMNGVLYAHARASGKFIKGLKTAISTLN